MSGIRNSGGFGSNGNGTQPELAAMLPEQNALPDGALQVLVAPTSFNGCVSEISSDAIHGHEHGYTAAMKHYGVVYEEYQSYLMPIEQSLPHDYDLAAKPIADFSHLGCLNADLLDSTVLADDVSDDDIETCGYMAWVHH